MLALEAPSGAVLDFALLFVVILLGPVVVEKAKVPGIIGLLLGGFAIGPHGLGWIETGNQTIPELGQLGLLYLMFVAGLELDLRLLSQYRRAAVTFAVLTFTFPFVFGGDGRVRGGVGDRLRPAARLAAGVAHPDPVPDHPRRRPGHQPGGGHCRRRHGAHRHPRPDDPGRRLRHGHRRGFHRLGARRGGDRHGPPRPGRGSLSCPDWPKPPWSLGWGPGGPLPRVRRVVPADGDAGGGLLDRGHRRRLLRRTGPQPARAQRGSVDGADRVLRLRHLHPGLPRVGRSAARPVGDVHRRDPRHRRTPVPGLPRRQGHRGRVWRGPCSGFTWDEAGVMFALTTPQAAATLAATIVGFDIGLFGTSVVNVVLVLILVSILVSTLLVVPRFAERIVAAEPTDALGARVLLATGAGGPSALALHIAGRLAAQDSGIVDVLMTQREGEPPVPSNDVRRLERQVFRGAIDGSVRSVVDRDIPDAIAHATMAQEASVVVLDAAARPVSGSWAALVTGISTIPAIVVCGDPTEIPAQVTVVAGTEPVGVNTIVEAVAAALAGGQERVHRSDVADPVAVPLGSVVVAPIDDWMDVDRLSSGNGPVVLAVLDRPATVAPGPPDD